MNNVVVVDASLAIKWVLVEDDSDRALMLLDRWISEGKELIAPALFTYEVTNILHRQVVKGVHNYEETRLALADLYAIGVRLDFSQHQDISMQAMVLAQRYKLPASYDAHYLALAEREDCEYWTADMRLWNAVKSKLSWVHALG